MKNNEYLDFEMKLSVIIFILGLETIILLIKYESLVSYWLRLPIIWCVFDKIFGGGNYLGW